MSFGILSQLSTESAGITTGKQDITADIMADRAYAEIVEIAHEADMQAAAMAQALVVADRLEEQVIATESMMSNPDMVTPATVALATESLNTAVIALGGEPEVSVSVEDANANPLQALEVTQEGIKDTAKKIYESIKMVFTKIGQAIKKLVAKVVIAVTNIEKKAESLYNKYKDKKLKKNTDLEDRDIADTYTPIAASNALKEIYGEKSTRALLNKLSSNVKDIINIHELIIETLKEVTSEKYTTTPSEVNKHKTSSIKNMIAGVFKECKDKYGEFAISDSWAGSIIDTKDYADYFFIPTNFTKMDIKGVLVYIENDSVENEENIYTVIKDSIKTKTVTPTISSDALNTDIFEKSDLLKALKDDYKNANKVVKGIAEDRQRDLDKISKAVDKNAKNSSGMTLLNKLTANEFNKLRVTASGIFISQIFTGVNAFKYDLEFIVNQLKTCYTEES